MINNPLQQFFRQPKIFVSLPSKGIYNKIGSIDGDVTNMPVFGMTGMDEILMKTPDALMTGDSTVKVIESCCPAIKDAWELSILDTDLVLAAIRIATYGNSMDVMHVCPNCKSENEYTLDLSKLVDHFSKFKYNNTVVVGNLTLKLQPVTYKQSTAFSLRNYELQQQLFQSDNIENKEEQQQTITNLFKLVGELQNEIYAASIESVDIGTSVVTERGYITEWLANCDKTIFDKIKEVFRENQKALAPPTFHVKCNECETESDISVELDQSNFFVKA